MKRIKTNEQRFLAESNAIEGMNWEASATEFAAFDKFMKLKDIMITDLCELVQAFQPDAKLRTITGMNVRVGNYYPPLGGMHILYSLDDLLVQINAEKISPYEAHVKYETLHPFTDGNGRSGRMIWWKMMKGSNLSFLHSWYYQSLDNAEVRK